MPLDPALRNHLRQQELSRTIPRRHPLLRKLKLDPEAHRARRETETLMPQHPGYRQVAGGPEMLARIYEEYPRLAQMPFRLIESNKPGKIEFYHPTETKDHPMPGWPVVELQADAPTGEWREKAVFGDMLHGMTDDPEWESMRREYEATMTPKQKERSRTRYETHRREFGEERPYEQWFEASDLDAPIRAWMAPDENSVLGKEGSWPNAANPMDTPKKHQELFSKMHDYLRRPPADVGSF